MQEILPQIFTWTTAYDDVPWSLNSYAITLDGHTILIDPSAPPESDWSSLDALAPKKIILTNRNHVRAAELFRGRYSVPIVAGADELSQFTPLVIDESVCEGDLIAGALRVIHLPGKSPGEIGLYFDPALHALSCEVGGILFVGDAIIGHPPGRLGLIPEPKLDDPALLRRSLRKLLAYDFEILLLCDGQPVLRNAKTEVTTFIDSL